MENQLLLGIAGILASLWLLRLLQRRPPRDEVYHILTSKEHMVKGRFEE